ncbi:MAG: hypothetical protein BWY06_02032 [Candidatus Latescibacteria bacterium ADurb.Bin168]|nr:MAG: hypothetical protein BWY06_02032 [Candidatus Latescibacteria bacterium ADurb.Bin168]
MRRFLATLLVCGFSFPVIAAVSVGQKGSDFSLSNVDDVRFSLATPRTTPLVLIFTTKDLGSVSQPWRDSLTTALGSAAQIQTVLDLGDVSRFLHSVARTRIRAQKSKAVLDWDGSVSTAWRGNDRSRVVVMVVAPDNTVRFMLSGVPVSPNVRQVTEAVRRVAATR